MRRPPARAALLLAASAALVGCAHRRAGDTGPREALAAVRFEGNTAPKGVEGWFAPQNDRALRNAVHQPAPSRLGVLLPAVFEPSWLDRDSLATDGLRVEVWYANHGYFDARFLGWEERRPRRPLRRRVKPVVLVGHVDQGEPSRVSEVSVEGLDALSRPLQARLRGLNEVVAGDIFDLETVRATQEAMVAHLQSTAYAHAKVDTHVVVDPAAHTVKVTLSVQAGPPCRFGEVTLSSTGGVPEELVLPYLEVKAGEPWSPKALAATRGGLLGLGAFSVVYVAPDPEALADPERRVIPVTVRLNRGKAQQLEVGPSFRFEPGEQKLTLASAYTNHNLGHRLVLLSQELEAGPQTALDTWGQLFALSPKDDVQPYVRAETKLSVPHVFAPSLTLGFTGRAALDLWDSFPYFQPTASPSLTWTGIPKVSSALSYRVSWSTFLDKALAGQTICDPATGEELTGDDLLFAFEQRVTYEGRNDPLEPSRGGRGSLSLAEAGGPLGGTANFVRARGEVTAYRSIPQIGPWNPGLFVLAGRLGAGWIGPLDPRRDLSVPALERFYLGGGTTVRGWGADRLGPLASESACQTASHTRPEQDAPTVPVGGNLLLLGNAELRVGWFYDVSGALFVDAGRVWASPGDLTLGGVLWTVGGGLRYNTAIGPVRADLAWRLGDPPEFVDEPRWTVHFGLTEAF